MLIPGIDVSACFQQTLPASRQSRCWQQQTADLQLRLCCCCGDMRLVLHQHCRLDLLMELRRDWAVTWL